MLSGQFCRWCSTGILLKSELPSVSCRRVNVPSDNGARHPVHGELSRRTSAIGIPRHPLSWERRRHWSRSERISLSVFDLAELNPKTLHFNLVVLTSAVDDVTVRVDRTEVACFIVLFPVEPGEYLSRLFLVLPVASHDLLPAYP